MEQIIAAIVFVGMATAQMSSTSSISGKVAISQPTLISESTPIDLRSLPPAPKGKSTIMGGEILDVDPVSDRFTLSVFGQRRIKILYDERTQIFLDGNAIPLRDLHPLDQASVQTVLDGTDVFALSIHILSRSPEGEFQGYVLNYNPELNELTVGAALSHEAFKLLVPINTRVMREGELLASGLSDLAKGALISVRFESDKKGRGIAREITILATPGSATVFSGNLSHLDMHSGSLVLVDPIDEMSHEIFVDFARFPGSRNLHDGDSVRVTATFDGTRYSANVIDVK